MDMETVEKFAITRETTIGDIVEHHPETIEVLLSYGVHCVGCDVSPYESLEEGFRGHGMSDEDIDDALEKLRDVIEHSYAPPTGHETITLTDGAVAKIKQILADKQKTALRIAVKAGGCSGLKYYFELDDTSTYDDAVIEHNGVRVYVDKLSLQKLAGATVDYKDTLTDAGFKIKNPQATSSCGCGSSFR